MITAVGLNAACNALSSDSQPQSMQQQVQPVLACMPQKLAGQAPTTHDCCVLTDLTDALGHKNQQAVATCC